MTNDDLNAVLEAFPVFSVLINLQLAFKNSNFKVFIIVSIEKIHVLNKVLLLARLLLLL